MLLLAFEEGHGFVTANKLVIDCWDVSLKVRRDGGSWSEDADGNVHSSAVEVLEALQLHCPYTLILIDTVDMASKMCTDHACSNAGVSHPSDGGDFGKGWDILQTAPFRRWYGQMTKLGVGLACTTHVDLKEIKNDKQKVIGIKRETTLPKGIQKFIHTQADVIINGTFGRRRRGMQERDRIVSFDGSAEVLAGTRIRGVPLPKNYIVTPPSDEDQGLPWKQWCGFFDAERGPGLAAQAEEFYNTGGVAGASDENVHQTAEPISETPIPTTASVEGETAAHPETVLPGVETATGSSENGGEGVHEEVPTTVRRRLKK